jgi:ABC-type transporter Mla subunit MlaD
MSALREYYDSKRSLRSLDADSPALARWLRRQTADLDQLTKTQRRQLEQVPGALHRSGRVYEKTQAFVDATTRWLKNGHELAQLRDRTKVELDDQVVNIGRIAARRRAQYAAGELDNDIIALIESIPGWYWATPDDTEDSVGDAAAQPPTRE